MVLLCIASMVDNLSRFTKHLQVNWTESQCLKFSSNSIVRRPDTPEDGTLTGLCQVQRLAASDEFLPFLKPNDSVEQLVAVRRCHAIRSHPSHRFPCEKSMALSGEETIGSQ